LWTWPPGGKSGFSTSSKTENGALDLGYKKALTDPSYLTINCLLNDTNYWLNLSGRALNRRGRTLDLSNQRVWLKLVQDLNKPKNNAQVKVSEGVFGNKNYI